MSPRDNQPESEPDTPDRDPATDAAADPATDAGSDPAADSDPADDRETAGRSEAPHEPPEQPSGAAVVTDAVQDSLDAAMEGQQSRDQDPGGPDGRYLPGPASLENPDEPSGRSAVSFSMEEPYGTVDPEARRPPAEESEEWMQRDANRAGSLAGEPDQEGGSSQVSRADDAYAALANSQVPGRETNAEVGHKAPPPHESELSPHEGLDVLSTGLLLVKAVHDKVTGNSRNGGSAEQPEPPGSAADPVAETDADDDPDDDNDR